MRRTETAAAIPPASTAAALSPTSSPSRASTCRGRSPSNTLRASRSGRTRSPRATSSSSARVAPGASHVGIAISPDEFVHAPSSSGVVRVESLTRVRTGRPASSGRGGSLSPGPAGAPVFARFFVHPEPRPHPADHRKPLQTLTVWRVIVQNDSGLYGADAPSERHVRAPQGRPLAESCHALVPGEGRGHFFVRARSPVPVLQLQAAVGHPPAALHQDQAQHRLRAVFAGQYLRPRRSFVPVLRGGLSHGGSDLRSCGAGRPGRPEGLGKHRDVLRVVQPPERWPDARPKPGCTSFECRSGPKRHPPSASLSVSSTRRTAGATTSTGTWSSTRPDEAPSGACTVLCVIVLPVATADVPDTAADASTRVRVCRPAVVGRRLRCCSDDRRQFFAPHHLRPAALGPRGRPGRHFRRRVPGRPAGAVPHRRRAGPRRRGCPARRSP